MFSDAFIFTMDLVLNKGSVDKHYILAGLKIFLVPLLFTSMVLTASFSGSIIAKLLVRVPPKTIDTLEDLRARPELKILVWKDSAMHMQFQNLVKGDKGMLNRIEGIIVHTEEDINKV